MQDAYKELHQSLNKNVFMGAPLLCDTSSFQPNLGNQLDAPVTWEHLLNGPQRYPGKEI